MASGTYIRTRAACARRASIALDRSCRIWTAKRVEAPRSRPGDNEVEEDEAIEDRGVAAIVDREEILRRMRDPVRDRSEEHTSELQSLMRISYAVFCLKKKKHKQNKQIPQYT